MHLDAEEARSIAGVCFTVGGAIYQVWKERRKKKAESKVEEAEPLEDSVVSVLKEEIAYLKDENAKKDAQLSTLYGFLDARKPKKDVVPQRPPEPDGKEP